MPRKPRLHIPGGLYHVILRGNARQEIFFDNDDRHRWESLIEAGLDRYGHRLHAYCWMTNHVHMAIQCRDDPLANFMRFVASGYARSTNKKYDRSGHLFERRHRAILVDADDYLMQLVRYIHRNPLRAGLVEDLSAYRWCSHRNYVAGIGPGWLTLGWVLGMFGSTMAGARRRYRRFMALEDSPALTHGFTAGRENDGRVFGSADFAASVGTATAHSDSCRSLPELVADISRERGVTAAELRSRSRERRLARIRAEIRILAVDSGIATNAEVARFFNRSQAALSRAAGRLRRQLKK